MYASWGELCIKGIQNQRFGKTEMTQRSQQSCSIHAHLIAQPKLPVRPNCPDLSFKKWKIGMYTVHNWMPIIHQSVTSVISYSDVYGKYDRWVKLCLENSSVREKLTYTHKKSQSSARKTNSSLLLSGGVFKHLLPALSLLAFQDQSQWQNHNSNLCSAQIEGQIWHTFKYPHPVNKVILISSLDYVNEPFSMVSGIIVNVCYPTVNVLSLVFTFKHWRSNDTSSE